MTRLISASYAAEAVGTAARPALGALERIWERLGNPLEWDEVQKVLIIVGVLVPGTFVALLRAIYLIDHPEVEPYVSRAALAQIGWAIAGYQFFGAILIAVGLFLRRTHRSTRAYAHLANQSWWLLFA